MFGKCGDSLNLLFTRTKKTKVRGVVFFSSLLFFTGVLFGYFVVSPLSINFLGGYFVSSIIQNQISFSSYINTVSILTLANGLIFSVTNICLFFKQSWYFDRIIYMRKYRKHSLVIILILSAIITPPDVTSQILLSLPVLFFYMK